MWTLRRWFFRLAVEEDSKPSASAPSSPAQSPQPQSQGETEAVAQHGIHHHGMGMLDQNDQKWPIFLVDQKDDLSKFLYVPLHRIQIIQETHQNTVVSVSF